LFRHYHAGPGLRTQLDEGLILGREALATRALDGRPDAILKMPGDSYAPFLLGLFSTLIFAAMLLHIWWLALAMLASFAVSLAAWLWPEPALGQHEPHGETLG
jgi:cytochrome c oxidase subunit 1/cytochrome c oxidase subunit I+III